MVLTSTVRGGVEEVVLHLLKRLDRRHFVLGLVAPRALLDALEPELANVEVQTFASSADSWLHPWGMVSLARAMRAFRPTIVNPHLFRSAMIAAPLAKALGVPRVVETYHGREAWRRGVIKGSFVPDRIVGRCVDRVIAVSRASGEFLVHTKGLSPEKVVVVPNGCDLSAFSPGGDGRGVRKELGLAQDALVVGIVGRLETQKGHVFGLEAFASLAPDYPHARLLIVGEGSLRDELVALAGQLGVHDRVIFTGYRGDVPRVLEAIDVVVLPSLHEGLPLTAIEAAAMAKPIVATAVDGTPEVVRQGVTGLLVPPADAAALSLALRELLERSEDRVRMGEAGRRHALASFGLDAHVEATADVYRQLVGMC
jgi:glycosyltransferase involved in cell wall biosynthesis